MPLRSVLWIGPAPDFDAGAATRSPDLDVAWVHDVEEALALPLEAFDAVVLDARDPLRVLDEARHLLAHSPTPPVLARVADAGQATADTLRKLGVWDVWEADGPGDSLLERLEALRPRASSPPRPAALVGSSRAMQEVYALVARAQRSSATVLLSGDTGTGKELLAREIHRGSTRCDQPFVAINCAAFPDTLLESELFGHVRGAFTGADRDNPGLFTVAGSGTLFLDEVGETSGPFQAKLLRVLQEREVRPVGGTRARSIEARVVAATNRELRLEVGAGHFREDLYYRLAVFPISVPPLRKRPEDILPLAEHFLALHGRREGKPECSLSREAGQLLLSYAWPGNVRELENEVQRALALAEPRETLGTALLSERLHGVLEAVETNVIEGETLRETMGRVEAWVIRRALERCGGRRTQTARRLGVTREGLYKKMKRLGIE
jgi:two-component system response regulator HydG